MAHGATQIKIDWKCYLTGRGKKCYSCVWAYRRAMCKTWGVRPKVALWTYKAVLLPKLLSASGVWWLMVSRVEVRNLLRSVWDIYLRSVRTTPSEVLEDDSCGPNSHWSSCGLTAYRVSGRMEGYRSRTTRFKFLQKYPFTLKQDRILISLVANTRLGSVP